MPHLSGDYKKEVVDRLGQWMDTIWTPEPISIDEPNMLKSVGINQGNVLALISRDGGTADAKDLKSFEEKFSWGFESPSRHLFLKRGFEGAKSGIATNRQQSQRMADPRRSESRAAPSPPPGTTDTSEPLKL